MRGKFTFLSRRSLHPPSTVRDETGSLPEEQRTASGLGRCSTREARALLPLDVAVRLPALPLGLQEREGTQRAVCAVPIGHRKDLEAELRFALGRTVEIVEVAAETLREAIVLAYHGDDNRLADEAQHLRSVSTTEVPLPALRPETGDAARFLATLLEYAVARGASDLHLLPRREGGVVRLRIGGDLRSSDEPVCPTGVFNQLITRLKVLAKLDINQRGMPQDGALSVPRDGVPPVSARVSIMPTLHGEKAVVRFLSNGGVAELGTLGLPVNLLDEISGFCDRRDGLALFAGPTGSGKSTSIYAVLRELARRNHSVVSIEDPVEAEVAGISQTSVSEALGLDYPTALRSVLRQDPDVIGLGEIRDRTSAEVALNAALTGHLVVSTVHATRVWEVPQRLMQLGINGGTIAQALRLIVCQRLVPTLCRFCKVIDLKPSNATGACIYREVGCARCDYSGFGDRRVVAEFLAPSRILADRIAGGERLTAEELQHERFRSLDSMFQELMRDGLVSARQYVGYVGDW